MMKNLRTGTLALLAVTALMVTPVAAVHVQATSTLTDTSRIAWFHDHWVDLSMSWEGATACNIATTGSVCFDSEAEMDQYLDSATDVTAAALAPLTITSTCSSALRLYTGTSYTGTVLNLSTEFIAINLSGYSFDNVTSSYKVGACDADFYSAANLGGTLYPGNTSANVWASTMLSGWDNVISSVYIN